MEHQPRTFTEKAKELAPTIGLLTLVVLTITLSVASQVSIGNRLDVMQIEFNRRFDAMQTENNRQHDAMQAEFDRRFDAMQSENSRQHDAMQAEFNKRFDAMQTENNRRFDELFEVLRLFEGRISQLEGRTNPVD